MQRDTWANYQWWHKFSANYHYAEGDKPGKISCTGALFIDMGILSRLVYV